jgi:hypothetical protein
MASIKLKGDTSGEITIDVPAVAGTNTLTLPASTGNVLTDGAALPAIDGSALTGVVPDALSTASGFAPSYSARAWVNFNGIGTVAIKASGNVSSITDNGTGDYTINFTTAMSDANYAASAFTCAYTINFGGALPAYYPTGTSTYIPQTKTTSAARILTGYTNVGGLIDNAEMSFIIYR